jgi:hypothetical protein
LREESDALTPDRHRMDHAGQGQSRKRSHPDAFLPLSMTERLSKGLKDNKISALTMDSSTTADRKLHPTAENGAEAKSKECDYILLTQIVDPKAHPESPRDASRRPQRM